MRTYVECATARSQYWLDNFLQVLEIANSAHGFVGADLAALCSEAAMVCLRRLAHCDPCSNISAVITREDFRLAEARVRPSGLRQVILEVPKVSWNDIGGLEDIKQQLREAVEWPFKSPDMLRKLGAKPPRGRLVVTVASSHSSFL